MTRIKTLACLLIAGLILVGADGCSSDPNVEGAKLDLRNKDYDRALENLSIALETNPDNVDALELKGQVISEMILGIRDTEEHTRLLHEMLDAWDRALLLDPTLEPTLGQAKAVAYSNEFQMGAQAFNRGRNDDSEYLTSAAFFKNAARIMPDSTGPYVNEAYALMNAGDQAGAVEPFETAIEKGDTDIDTYRLLAGIYQALGREAEAVTTLETAGELYQSDAQLQNELLNAYQRAGQTDRALEVYASAVESDPQNKLYRYNYGSLLVIAERYDDAIVQLQAAVAIDPEYANAHYNLGAAYINQAVDVNEQLTMKDDEYRANSDNMTQAQRDAANQEMNDMADERRALFAMAVGPLEQARTLMEESGEDATETCGALYQAYVQTNEIEKAQAVAACAGLDDSSN